MCGTTRFGPALVLIALAALGVAERVAFHAHSLDESDLAPHPVALVDGEPNCERLPHLDSGSSADHPVCVECVLAAAAVALAPSTPSRLAADSVRRPLALPAASLPVSARPRAHGARGPPRA